MYSQCCILELSFWVEIFTLDAILLFHGKIFYKMFVLYGYEDTCFSKMIRLFSENFYTS